uniref:Uncharacterized protein n=1 Tax=Anguilla anguilla TaxID=7936 RepID=A0A0E9SBM6_ANGAN
MYCIYLEAMQLAFKQNSLQCSQLHGINADFSFCFFFFFSCQFR